MQTIEGMDKSRELKVADGGVLQVTQKTCPIRISLHINWGQISLDPFSFAVMPGNDNVVIIGSPKLPTLGIDMYDSLGEHARAAHDTVIG